MACQEQMTLGEAACNDCEVVLNKRSCRHARVFAALDASAYRMRHSGWKN